MRIATGALVLVTLAAFARRARTVPGGGGDARSALALFAYAAAFSYAYVALPAGTGALLLFGAVQATMLGADLRAGERLRPARVAGLALALAGLVVLVLPGLGAPAPLAAGLMLAAGVAWGVYSLRGRGSPDPLGQTAGNFARALPFAALLAAAAWALGTFHLDVAGAGLATASGALASGVGYALWYGALRRLSATEAGIVQLSVPVLAALGGVVLLAEPVTLRLVVASVIVLGGVGLALRRAG